MRFVENDLNRLCCLGWFAPKKECTLGEVGLARIETLVAYAIDQRNKKTSDNP